jgi:hypothetical protein
MSDWLVSLSPNRAVVVHPSIASVPSRARMPASRGPGEKPARRTDETDGSVREREREQKTRAPEEKTLGNCINQTLSLMVGNSLPTLDLLVDLDIVDQSERWITPKDFDLEPNPARCIHASNNHSQILQFLQSQTDTPLFQAHLPG